MHILYFSKHFIVYIMIRLKCEKEQHFDDELVTLVNSFEKSALEFAESFENGYEKRGLVQSCFEVSFCKLP